MIIILMTDFLCVSGHIHDQSFMGLLRQTKTENVMIWNYFLALFHILLSAARLQDDILCS